MHVRNKQIGALLGLFWLSACAAPSPSLPDAEVSARPVQGPKLRYPVDLLNRGIEGEADISCAVTVQGDTEDCLPIRTVGALEFKDAALSYVRSAKYRPAIRNGVPAAEPQHYFSIKFVLAPMSPLSQQVAVSLSADWAQCVSLVPRPMDHAAIDGCGRVIDALETPAALRGQAYQLRARGLAMLQLYEQAAEDYGRAIDLGSFTSDTYLQRGLAYLELKQYARANADFDFVLKISLNDVDALRSHARADLALADYPAARRNIDAAIAIRPDDPSLRIARAEVLIAAGNQMSALADLDEVLRMNPTEVPALADRCRVYRQANRSSEADADCARVETLDPKHKTIGVS